MVTSLFEVFGVPEGIVPTKMEWRLMHKRMKQRYHPDKFNTRSQEEIELFNDFYSIISSVYVLGANSASDDYSPHSRAWHIPDYTDCIIKWDFAGTPLSKLVSELQKDDTVTHVPTEYQSQKDREEESIAREKQRNRKRNKERTIAIIAMLCRGLWVTLCFMTRVIIVMCFANQFMRTIWGYTIALFIFAMLVALTNI